MRKREDAGAWLSLDLTVNRVSAAELALLHTGAILFSLGYHMPATATWRALTEDKCVCACTAVVSDNAFL